MTGTCSPPNGTASARLAGGLDRHPVRMLMFVLILALPATSSALQVTQTIPDRNTVAPISTAISVTFDEPVDLSSVNISSFRVFGKRTGPVRGDYVLANDGQTVTLLPDQEFGYGEGVIVNLSHDLEAADGSPLRAAGYSFGFRTEVLPSSRTYTQIQILSNVLEDEQTQIYGAAAMDWNRDGYTDLATINETSADVRVTLNTGDGSGLFEPILPPHPIGIGASPNEPADFDNDGIADLCVSAAATDDVWILRGLGDGTFGFTQTIVVGDKPHGIMPIDVDGDGDSDIVTGSNGSNNVAILINDGAGVFGAPTYFEGGVNGEYGLAVGDMNNDGITDLVITSRDAAQIITQLGNGNGTFTPAGTSQPSGGFSWTVVVDDVNGDGNLDASTANSASNNAAILLGLGNGRFGTPTTVATGGHTVGTDLGDADGDGDLDWVVSSYGGGSWLLFENTGGGAFVFDQEFEAPRNPSCAIFLDFDNDGDLDFGLTDEIADVIVFMRNEGPASEIPNQQDVDNIKGGVSSYPDPFTRDTRIRFANPAPGQAILEVFDASGRRVAEREFVVVAGVNETVFDGLASDGARLGSGLYMYTVRITNSASDGAADHDRGGSTRRLLGGRMTILR